jgi:hypothetical protein
MVDKFTLKPYTYCIYYKVLNVIIDKGEPGIYKNKKLS